MKKFLVLYLAPSSVLEEWSKTPREKREEAESKMRAEWDAWMKDHKEIFPDLGGGVGKTKRVTSKGISDTKNDIMLYGIVEAETHQEAAKLFESHPHLGIPEASIEIMELSPLVIK